MNRIRRHSCVSGLSEWRGNPCGKNWLNAESFVVPVIFHHSPSRFLSFRARPKSARSFRPPTPSRGTHCEESAAARRRRGPPPQIATATRLPLLSKHPSPGLSRTSASRTVLVSLESAGEEKRYYGAVSEYTEYTAGNDSESAIRSQRLVLRDPSIC